VGRSRWAGAACHVVTVGRSRWAGAACPSQGTRVGRLAAGLASESASEGQHPSRHPRASIRVSIREPASESASVSQYSTLSQHLGAGGLWQPGLAGCWIMEPRCGQRGGEGEGGGGGVRMRSLLVKTVLPCSLGGGKNPA
jgi:hypothetical protein